MTSGDPTTEPGAFEPTEPGDGGDPTCETWHEVFPDFCREVHVDAWQDNGDNVLSECDVVIIDGQECHIERIGLNIIVEPPSTATEESTWGKVKSMFRDAF